MKTATILTGVLDEVLPKDALVKGEWYAGFGVSLIGERHG